MSQYFVYILKNPEGRLYIGFTADLPSRVQRHMDDKAGWTKGKGPWKLTYFEAFSDRKEALQREKYFKHGKANQEIRKLLSPDE